MKLKSILTETERISANPLASNGTNVFDSLETDSFGNWILAFYKGKNTKAYNADYIMEIEYEEGESNAPLLWVLDY
jgi:hypothetical protein